VRATLSPNSSVPFCEIVEHQVKKYAVKSGDLLVARTGGTVGKSFLISNVSEPTVFASYLIRLSLKTEIEPRYLFHFFQSAAYWRQIGLKKGGLLGNVNATTLASIELPVCPRPEQQRIASKIDELFSRIEEGERLLEQVQKLVERYRQSVLMAAVTGELTRAWREQHKGKLESGEALLQRILKARRAAWEKAELGKMKAKGQKPANDHWKQKYQEPSPPDTSDLPELPEGWVWGSMDQLTTKITSGSCDWKDFYDRGTSVFVMAQNVRPRRLDLTEMQFVDPPAKNRDAERSEVFQHDLLITIVGANTGDACWVREPLLKHYVCQSVALMRPVLGSAASFLELYLCADEGGRAQFADEIYGAGRPHLSFDNLRAICIPIPSLDEQLVICDAVSRIESDVDGVTRTAIASAATSMSLRQSVLRTAFSGGLVSQDPTDEPATVLLERIAAERSANTNPKRGRKKKSP
jgi:type I restriction enzyme S subunit